MQHIYSLRPTRPATAASEENPLPVPSVAKTRRFISNNIGHAIRRTAGGALDPPLAKKLAQLVAMEKNILRSMENVSKERMDNARQLSSWGSEQEEDISDVSDKLSVLLYQVGDLEDQYVDRYDQYRSALKDIRDMEKVVHRSRDRKEKITDQIAKLQGGDANKEELEQLQQELVRVEAESIAAEVQLVTTTREKIKGGFHYQFEAMREFGEKLAIIAGYGQHMLELIDDRTVVAGESLPTYSSHDASEAIVKECDRSLTTWVGSNAATRDSTRLSGRVQSMIHQQKEAGDAAGGASAPTNTRRWSSDSETEERSPVLSSISKKLNLKPN